MESTRITLRRIWMADCAAPAVRSHYEALGGLYRAAWGDSLHFGVYGPDDDRSRAAAAVERKLADEAGMLPGAQVLDVGCGTGGAGARDPPVPGGPGTRDR